MPPLYSWKDKKSDKKIEVIRKFDAYQDPPTQDECDWDVSEAEWERVISSNISVKRPWNWAGKGNWLLLAGIVAASLAMPSCVTPNKWRPEDHREQMLVCKKMCEPSTVNRYDPFTGDCTCYILQEQP